MADPSVAGVLARVYVDDLDAALPLYERLAGKAAGPPRRFDFGGVELAWVGHFLLLAGDTGPYRDRAATLLVHDASAVADEIVAAGGAVLEGPTDAPNGARLIARHPDGTVFEYIEVPSR